MDKIKQLWKRLGAWGIGLKSDNIFVKTRVEFAISFGIAVLVILTVFTVFLNFLSVRDVSNNLEDKFIVEEIEQMVIQKTVNDLQRHSYLVHIAVSLGAIIVGYIFSGLVLKPLWTSIQSQKRFIADASHELRTPLSIMKTNSEVALMESKDSNPEDAVTALKENIHEIDRMSGIIKNLLNLSHIDDKSHKMAVAKINLASVVDQVTKDISKLREKKGVNVLIKRNDPAGVWGNATALEEMLLNLVKNAVYYTPEGGTVSIESIDRSPDGAELVVSDTGIGMEPSEVAHIFDPFYKTKRGAELRKEGFGLGLSIVREIVKKHNASIKVKSKPDQGTTFVINFKGLAIV